MTMTDDPKLFDPRRSFAATERPAPYAAVPFMRQSRNLQVPNTIQTFTIVQTEDHLIEFHKFRVLTRGNGADFDLTIDLDGTEIGSFASLLEMAVNCDEFSVLETNPITRLFTFEFRTPVVLDGGPFMGDKITVTYEGDINLWVAFNGWIADKRQMTNRPVVAVPVNDPTYIEQPR